jgi:hypothetical protein
VNILRRIRRALARFNRRLIAGTTGGTARDVSMIEDAERQQFQVDEDKNGGS